MRSSILVLPLLLTLGCDRTGTYLVPQPTEGLEPVLEMGQLDIISSTDWSDTTLRQDLATFADIGAPEPGDKSGATYTFLGTGGKVCVVVDPEAVFWNTSVATANPSATYSWEDNFFDDGDVNMKAGFSANYTGSPGIELGDFYGFYTDSLGNTVEIEYNLCESVDYYGDTPAYAGRSTPEYCTIDTTGREGIEYTVLLETFALPIDDAILSFATAVSEGGCRNVNECTLRDENRQVWVEGDTINAEVWDHYTGEDGMEQAYCSSEMFAWCEANPEHCGNPPDGYTGPVEE